MYGEKIGSAQTQQNDLIMTDENEALDKLAKYIFQFQHHLAS